MPTTPSPICNSNPFISRDRRTVVLIAPERVLIGADTISEEICARIGGFEQLLVYDSFDPVRAEFDTIKLNRARNGLGPEGFAIGVGTQRVAGTTYLNGSGYPNVAPVWSKLMRAAGWSEARFTASSLTGPTGTPTATAVTTGTPTTAPSLGMGNSLKFLYKASATVASSAETKLGTASSAMSAATASSGAAGVEVDLSGLTLPANSVYVNIYRTFGHATAPAAPYYLIDRLTLAQFNALSSGIYRDGFADNQLVDISADEAGSTNKVVWQPMNESDYTNYLFMNPVTIWVYLDGRLHQVYHSRGTLNFSADAGQPVKCDFDMQGQYYAAEQASNPSALATPGFPNRLVAIGCRITPQTTYGGFTADTAITPVVKSFGLNLGAQVTPRLDAQQDEGILEYTQSNDYDPRLTMQIEMNKAVNQDYIETFKRGYKFHVYLTIGSGAGNRITIQSDTSYDVIAGSGTKDYTLQLASPPTYGDSNGVRVVNLEFIPTPGDIAGSPKLANFFKVQQY